MKKMKNIYSILTLTLIAFSTIAKENVATSGGGSNLTGGKILAGCQFSASRAVLEVNNVRTTLLNGGDMWWDLDNARYEIPKLDDPFAPKKHSLFAGAIWLGGRDQPTGGNLLLVSQTYRQSSQYSYWPGPIVQNAMDINADECTRWDQHFKVNKTNIDNLKNLKEFPTTADTNVIATELFKWPAKGNPFISVFNDKLSSVNTNRNLAPFVDVNNDGVYNPLDGDYPDVRGDQAIWWVMNDVGGQKLPTSNPIGLEMQVEAFAFASTDDLNNMTFYKQKIINKGPNKVFNTYLGQWVDPDLGKYDDDYVECDVARGLGICYNGDNDDEGINGYGLNPPSIGVDFFSGPLADENDGIDNNRNGVVDEPGEKIIMSNFLYYNNDANPVNGNPSTAQDFYNYLRNIWRNNTAVVYDGLAGTTTGPACNFMFPGSSDEYGWGVGGTPSSPNIQAPWTEVTAGNTPADRRFLQSAGPFTMDSGEETDVIIGVVWARASSGGARGSFGRLLKASDFAQKLFDNDFELPNGPNAPELDIQEFDQELIVSIKPTSFLSRVGPNLANDIKNEQTVTTDTYLEFIPGLVAARSNNDPYYRFQGFLVYQVNGSSTPTDYTDQNKVRLIAQCDKKDGVKILINSSKDIDNGFTIPKTMVIGEDNGLKYSFKITKDAFATGNDRLVNYKDYYFLVKAYASNLDEINLNATIDEVEQYLESKKNVKTFKATPHKTRMEFGGFTPGVEWGQALPVKRISGNGGTGNNVLKLKDDTRDKVFDGTYNGVMEYADGFAPINVEVVDVKNLVPSDYNIKFRSVLEVSNALSKVQYKVGDTLTVPTLPTLTRATDTAEYRPGIQQVPGIAVIQEVIPAFDGNSTVYYVNVLNAQDGGTFRLQYDSLKRQVSGTTVTLIFESHKERALKVIKKGEAVPADSVALYSKYFAINDSWVITDKKSNKVVKSNLRLKNGEEQFIPEFGIVVRTRNANNPSFKFRTETPEILESFITYKEPAKAWLKQEVDPTVWLEQSQSTSYDPTGAYYALVGGKFAPYFYAKNFNSNGPAYFNSNNLNANVVNRDGQLNRLRNVDIILTDDKSKWTEVVVLQYDQQGTQTQAGFRLNKSLLPSVDKNFLPTGAISPMKNAGTDSLSRGKSWFPGYALDIDRGVRLNMMFSESRIKDVANGNNLRFDYNRADTMNSFIYVLNSEYNSCRDVESVLDSIRFGNPSASNLQNRLNNAYSSFNIMYVGNIPLRNRARATDPVIVANQTDAIISLRVNREFENKGAIQPEYEFSSEGYGPKKGQSNLAKDALDLIRAVPNPYYAYSQYELNQLQNTIKFTNLPEVCNIKIYTVSGTLIRTITKDNRLTFQEWNLQNQENIPIASGTYIIHIDAPGIGEKIIKWIGVIRPIDLETF
jgi:hypothetical protein